MNLAIAPTLVYAFQSIALQLPTKSAFKIHCIGATDDFEGRADWSQLPALLRAAGLALPSRTEITYVGVEKSFNLGPYVEAFKNIPFPSAGRNTTIHKRQGLYHDVDLPRPDVVLATS